MSTNKPYPSSVDFLIKVPLYETVHYDDENLECGRRLFYFDETFDSYCPECNSHSIFEPFWVGQRHISHNKSSWVDKGIFLITVQCTRNRDHKLRFIFNVTGQEIQKIGQLPSIANLNLFDVKKYSTAIDSNYFKEFTKAIGLAAHGVGVGSFVYLRRIFEFLMEESHVKAKHNADWDEELYIKSRVSKKIELLKSELPDFLVENKAMYSILSKGIHELSEDDCLKAFPIIKVGIEIILDEKLDNLRRVKKLDEARKAISSLNQSI